MAPKKSNRAKPKQASSSKREKKTAKTTARQKTNKSSSAAAAASYRMRRGKPRLLRKQPAVAVAYGMRIGEYDKYNIHSITDQMPIGHRTKYMTFLRCYVLV